MSTIRRGEFYEWTPAAGRGRYVLVLSDDAANLGMWPVCAPILRGSGAGSLWVVSLADTDPVSGRVALYALAPRDPARLSGPHGMVSGPTFDRLSGGIRELFGL